MGKNKLLTVNDLSIGLKTIDNKDFISITDIAKYRNQLEPFSVINNWLRSRSTIEYLGLWEKLNNPDFKPIEFDRFRNDAGSNYFTLSPQRWADEIVGNRENSTIMLGGDTCSFSVCDTGRICGNA